MQECAFGLQRTVNPAELQLSMQRKATACRQQQDTGSSTAGLHKHQPTCIIAFSRVRGIMHSSALSCTMGCMGKRSIAATTASTPLSLATRHWLACRIHYNIKQVQQHVSQASSKLLRQVNALLGVTPCPAGQFSLALPVSWTNPCCSKCLQMPADVHGPCLTHACRRSRVSKHCCTCKCPKAAAPGKPPPRHAPGSSEPGSHCTARPPGQTRPPWHQQ